MGASGLPCSWLLAPASLGQHELPRPRHLSREEHKTNHRSRDERVVDPQHLLRGTAHGMIGGDEDRTGQLLGQAVMVERRPVGDRHRRREFHGDDEFMELRRRAFSGRKRDDGEAAAADARDPALRLELFEKLPSGVVGLMLQDRAHGRSKTCPGLRPSPETGPRCDRGDFLSYGARRWSSVQATYGV